MYGYTNAPTPAPRTDFSEIEDDISNDQDCWWCGRSNNNNSSLKGNWANSRSNTSTYFGGAFFAVSSIAVAALLRQNGVSSYVYFALETYII